MATVVWTERAFVALDEIVGYIAKRNADAAWSLAQRVYGFTAHLERFPELGRVLPEARGAGLTGFPICRELVVRPCRIFYRFDAGRNVVFVVNVIRGEREFSPKMIDPSREET